MALDEQHDQLRSVLLQQSSAKQEEWRGGQIQLFIEVQTFHIGKRTMAVIKA